MSHKTKTYLGEMILFHTIEYQSTLGEGSLANEYAILIDNSWDEQFNQTNLFDWEGLGLRPPRDDLMQFQTAPTGHSQLDPLMKEHSLVSLGQPTWREFLSPSQYTKGPHGYHGSYHREIVLPSPTSHFNNLQARPLACKIFLRDQEASWGILIFQKFRPHGVLYGRKECFMEKGKRYMSQTMRIF